MRTLSRLPFLPVSDEVGSVFSQQVNACGVTINMQLIHFSVSGINLAAPDIPDRREYFVRFLETNIFFLKILGNGYG
jgi:hypothetical protein